MRSFRNSALQNLDGLREERTEALRRVFRVRARQGLERDAELEGDARKLRVWALFRVTEAQRQPRECRRVRQERSVVQRDLLVHGGHAGIALEKPNHQKEARYKR